ncbi:hypothetical protein [Schleiferilactobacillus shenzhenensis]|uniref:Uncharacterized protein n=1 Tax=Schleiferilactobacillus shenzhenensis LY-73 TaxID=1231336 RepID=U4TPX3_9LACO|nr:hypothetical protein [Schleiferilactobacillus shenzhenensis]ERL65495.1 hypothetical protein L248_2568 [Schleiferilactobacillus shenzhenensis LY-73]
MKARKALPLMLMGALTLLLFAFFGLRLLHNPSAETKTQSAGHSVFTKKVTETNPLSKKLTTIHKAKDQMNAAYYKHPVVNVGSEAAIVNYPDTFTQLINRSELSVEGVVGKLTARPYQQMAFTMADITVRKVLHGDQKFVGQTIPVLFSGGNISKKMLYSGIAMKDALQNKQDQETVNSQEIVTVQYTAERLPRVGDAVALVLARAPEGANGITEPVWGTSFGAKGIFFRTAAGDYERTPATVPTGNGQESRSKRSTASADNDEQADDEKMNAGMTELVQHAFAQ